MKKIDRLLFLMKSNSLTIFVIIVSAVHLYAIIYAELDKYLLKKAILVHRPYAVLYFITFAFWGFLFLTVFRKTLKTFHWWINLLLTCGMAWISCPFLFLSLVNAQLMEWIYAVLMTIAAMLIHTSLAMFDKPFYDFLPDFLVKWSILSMVTSTLGVILAISWKSTPFDVLMMYFGIFFHIVLTVLVGRTLGSVDLFVSEIEPNEWYYIILIHYNFIILFSLLMLATCKTRCVLPNKTTTCRRGNPSCASDQTV